MNVFARRSWISVLLVTSTLISFITTAYSADLVGTIPGSFDVSATGATRYQIPIETPTATGGLRPSLALEYNHRGGNGVAGQGWQLLGLSRITRCPQTIAQDGTIRGVQYDSGDRFCLDGQRLILISGTYGQPNSEYRTEVDSSRQIIAYGTQGNGPSYFIVRERDGTRHYYGHNNNSSLIDSSTNSYQFWTRYQVRDMFQNVMDFYFSPNATTGEFLLTQILYTTNSNQSLVARYRVVFTYEGRPLTDRRFGYRYGAIWSRDNRLKKIAVTHNDPTSGWGTISDYTLTYATGTSDRSQITSIKRCRGTDCLLASNFTWQQASPGWATAVSSGQSSVGHSKTLVGDFDGDGQQDLFVQSGGEWHVLRGSPTGFLAPLDTNKPTSFCTKTLDFNGDGKTDLLTHGASAKWHLYESTGTGFNDITTTATTTPCERTYAQDVDGDKLDDVLHSSGARVYLRKSTGTNLETTTSIVLTTAPHPKEILGLPYYEPNRLMDFNGDGMGDIIVNEEATVGPPWDPIEVAHWEAYVFDGTAYQHYKSLGASLGAKSFAPVDMNNDGLTDVAVYSGGWTYELSNGKTFVTQSNPAVPDSNWSKALFADYNADGRKDLIRATSSNWYVHKSYGSGFETTGISIGGSGTTYSPGNSNGRDRKWL